MCITEMALHMLHFSSTSSPLGLSYCLIIAIGVFQSVSHLAVVLKDENIDKTIILDAGSIAGSISKDYTKKVTIIFLIQKRFTKNFIQINI